MSDNDDDDGSIGRGGLSDQLSGLNIDAPDQDELDDDASDASDDDSPHAGSGRTRAASGPAAETQQQDERGEDALSDEELFEQAIAEMSPDEARRAKDPARQRIDRASRPIGTTEQGDKIPDRESLPDAAEADALSERETNESAPRKPSERDLFEQAVSEIGPEDVYRGKFEGRGADLGPEPDEEPRKSPGVPGQTPPKDDTSEPEIDEESAREKLGELREFRQFEKAVGSVDQDVERDKYRDRTTRRDPKQDVEQRLAYRSDSPDEMITPPLPKSGEGLNNVGSLVPAQKDMIERYDKRMRRDEVFEINVRGDTVEDALRQVELFVHQQWKEHAKFCRIIHGRGLRSKGDPVLKPAILRWLEGPGFRYIRGYAPQINEAGDYGSVVVELAERREDR